MILVVVVGNLTLISPIFLVMKMSAFYVCCMRGSRKLCQRGFTFDVFFLVDERREDPNTTISVPSSQSFYRIAIIS